MEVCRRAGSSTSMYHLRGYSLCSWEWLEPQDHWYAHWACNRNDFQCIIQMYPRYMVVVIQHNFLPIGCQQRSASQRWEARKGMEQRFGLAHVWWNRGRAYVRGLCRNVGMCLKAQVFLVVLRCFRSKSSLHTFGGLGSWNWSSCLKTFFWIIDSRHSRFGPGPSQSNSPLGCLRERGPETCYADWPWDVLKPVSGRVVFWCRLASLYASWISTDGIVLCLSISLSL